MAEGNDQQRQSPKLQTVLTCTGHMFSLCIFDGILGFSFGVFFCLPSDLPRFATFLNALSLNSSGRTFAHWAVATCGIYELGGILFVMGSVP